MPDLDFEVEGAAITPWTVAPQMAFRLRVTNAPPEGVIHSVVLNCQIRLEVTRRQYVTEEKERLRDLFGEPERWGRTLRPMLWTLVTVTVPRFEHQTTVELPVQCSSDFNLAATKFFYGLTDGEVPLDFLFSGSVFYEDATGSLQVAPIAWTKEARFRLPVKLWQELMEIHYPNAAWFQLRRDVFDRLYRYKVEHGIPTWEQAVERLLPAVDEEARV
ncbi:MAG TPA: DUF6084 family protein [Gemmatimonadales bacterium]|jgi:hypothetical protein